MCRLCQSSFCECCFYACHLTDENSCGRLVHPYEVANIVKLLVSDAGNMIVGETVHISGGRGIFDIR